MWLGLKLPDFCPPTHSTAELAAHAPAAKTDDLGLDAQLVLAGYLLSMAPTLQICSVPCSPQHVHNIVQPVLFATSSLSRVGDTQELEPRGISGGDTGGHCWAMHMLSLMLSDVLSDVWRDT